MVLNPAIKMDVQVNKEDLLAIAEGWGRRHNLALSLSRDLITSVNICNGVCVNVLLIFCEKSSLPGQQV